MTINEDFDNRAETEMKMHDAKMMELARLKKLATETLEARIAFALSKKENNAEEALAYMQEHHLIHEGEKVALETLQEALKKGSGK